MSKQRSFVSNSAKLKKNPFVRNGLYEAHLKQMFNHTSNPFLLGMQHITDDVSQMTT